MIKYAFLKLVKSDYIILRDALPGNSGGFVFQFMLSKQENIFPKLRAYAMLNWHGRKNPIVFKNLVYTVDNPTALLSITTIQVLGDLQIKKVIYKIC